MKYTDLIFDLYGTLVDIHTEESDGVWEKCASFFRENGVEIDGKALKEQYQKEIALREGKMGQEYECYPDIPFDEVMECIFARGGVKGAKDLAFKVSRLFRTLSTEYIRLYAGVRERLAELREKGYRLWLLSNAQQVFTEYELRDLDLYHSFDGVYLSSNYGVRKPDHRFYKVLIDEQNLDIKKCLMIGNDRDTDILGAKNLGMATLYMHTLLTPSEQKEADERLHPDRAVKDTKHFEFEGDDWSVLAPLIDKICR